MRNHEIFPSKSKEHVHSLDHSKRTKSEIKRRLKNFSDIPNSREDGSFIGPVTKLRLIFAKSGTVGVKSKYL